MVVTSKIADNLDLKQARVVVLTANITLRRGGIWNLELGTHFFGGNILMIRQGLKAELTKVPSFSLKHPTWRSFCVHMSFARMTTKQDYRVRLGRWRPDNMVTSWFPVFFSDDDGF